jgi:hypothetical protein
LAAKIYTPEEISRTKKIEAIFSPHAYREREKKRVRDNPGVDDYSTSSGRFSHYTSAEAALKILESKRLWMRSSLVMADYREVEHGHDLLLDCFGKKRDAFLAAADAIHSDIAKNAMSLFDKWWGQIRLGTYVTSVSDHRGGLEDVNGRLSMWRAFGGTSPRVAIVFRVPWYSPAAVDLGVIFSPVAYLGNDGANAILDEVMVNLATEKDFLKTLSPEEFHGSIFQMLVAAVFCAKHEGFEEEAEWRGVYCPAFKVPALVEKAGVLVAGVPQTIYQVPFDATKYPQLDGLDLSQILDRIIVGPTSYPWVMYEAFVDALTAAGVPNPVNKVIISNIPIRGP